MFNEVESRYLRTKLESINKETEVEKRSTRLSTTIQRYRVGLYLFRMFLTVITVGAIWPLYNNWAKKKGKKSRWFSDKQLSELSKSIVSRELETASIQEPSGSLKKSSGDEGQFKDTEDSGSQLTVTNDEVQQSISISEKEIEAKSESVSSVSEDPEELDDHKKVQKPIEPSGMDIFRLIHADVVRANILPFFSNKEKMELKKVSKAANTFMKGERTKWEGLPYRDFVNLTKALDPDLKFCVLESIITLQEATEVAEKGLTPEIKNQLQHDNQINQDFIDTLEKDFVGIIALNTGLITLAGVKKLNPYKNIFTKGHLEKVLLKWLRNGIITEENLVNTHNSYVEALLTKKELADVAFQKGLITFSDVINVGSPKKIKLLLSEQGLKGLETGWLTMKTAIELDKVKLNMLLNQPKEELEELLKGDKKQLETISQDAFTRQHLRWSLTPHAVAMIEAKIISLKQIAEIKNPNLLRSVFSDQGKMAITEQALSFDQIIELSSREDSEEFFDVLFSNDNYLKVKEYMQSDEKFFEKLMELPSVAHLKAMLSENGYLAVIMQFISVEQMAKIPDDRVEALLSGEKSSEVLYSLSNNTSPITWDDINTMSLGHLYYICKIGFDTNVDYKGFLKITNPRTLSLFFDADCAKAIEKGWLTIDLMNKLDRNTLNLLIAPNGLMQKGFITCKDLEKYADQLSKEKNNLYGFLSAKANKFLEEGVITFADIMEMPNCQYVCNLFESENLYDALTEDSLFTVDDIKSLGTAEWAAILVADDIIDALKDGKITMEDLQYSRDGDVVENSFQSKIALFETVYGYDGPKV